MFFLVRAMNLYLHAVKRMIVRPPDCPENKRVWLVGPLARRRRADGAYRKGYGTEHSDCEPGNVQMGKIRACLQA